MVVKNMDLLLILIGKLHYFICEILRVLSSIQKKSFTTKRSSQNKIVTQRSTAQNTPFNYYKLKS